MTQLQRQECYKLYDQIIEGLEERFLNDEIDEDDYTRLKIKSLAELETSLIELTGLKESQVDENENYMNNNANMNYANFNMTGYFVPALIECIEQDYETLEDGLSDVLEVTGLTERQLDKVLSGELYPTPEMVDILNELFTATSTDEENALTLQAFAAVDRGDLEEEVLLEVINDEEYDYEDEYDDEEMEDEELEETDESEDDGEEESVEPDAAYSYINSEVEELKSKIANFEFNAELQSRLNDVADYARQGINERWLTRYKRDLLLGSFDKIEDMTAAFSQNAESNGVDLETHLYAVEFALQADQKAGHPSVDFSQYVNENINSLNNEEDELALLQIEKMKEGPLFKNRR